jgi:hypothetical protein
MTLKQEANPGPLVNWLQSRWQSLKELALTEVEFENLQLDRANCSVCEIDGHAAPGAQYPAEDSRAGR